MSHYTFLKSLIKRKLFGLIIQAQKDLERRELEANLSSLKSRGRRIIMDPTVKLTGAEYMEIGDDAIFQPYSRIEAVASYSVTEQMFHPKIRIGARTSVEIGVHIGACRCVEIGDDVMIAGRAYIADHVHHYTDPAKPVGQQPISEVGQVKIGNGSHIGEGACIFSNVTIGEHVVVGANAVVTKDVPAFCVAAGVPARIIRHYDFAEQCWKPGPPETVVSNGTNV